MGREAATTFQLLSSTRYDPYLTTLSWNDDEDGSSPFFLLPLHFQRLISSAEIHDWFLVKDLVDYRALKSACLSAVSEQGSRIIPAPVLKIRITVSMEGRIAVTATPLLSSFTYDPTVLPPPESSTIDYSHEGSLLRLYVDNEPMTPTIFTKTKTTFRYFYDAAKARNESQRKCVPENSAWDVLLYNEHGYIMETTIFNIAFYRSSRWITPSANTGCLPGVLRRWLLDNGRIIEDTEGQLTKNTLQNGELVLLFNGVQGVRLGRIYV